MAVETGWGAIVFADPCGRAASPTSSVSVRTVHLKLETGPAPQGVNSWPVRVVRAVFRGDLTQIHVA